MLRHAWALIAPPLCAVCGEATDPSDALCGRCSSAIERSRSRPVVVPGADWAIAATDYEGVPRAAVIALKFHGRLSIADRMAEAIAGAGGDRLDGATLVPVPPARRRRRRRGFDPAEAIARSLSRGSSLPLSHCLSRADGPRQVGRPRRDRLGAPPIVTASAAVPLRTLLVDDVATTGATLAACARALRAGGAAEVGAIAFARAR